MRDESSKPRRLVSSSRSDNPGNGAVDGDGQVDWAALVPFAVHPTKVLVIEAMRWIDRPLSASELENVFDRKLSTSAISYHVVTLARWGVLKPAGKQKVRGAWKRLYRLADLSKAGT